MFGVCLLPPSFPAPGFLLISYWTLLFSHVTFLSLVLQPQAHLVFGYNKIKTCLKQKVVASGTAHNKVKTRLGTGHTIWILGMSADSVPAQGFLSGTGKLWLQFALGFSCCGKTWDLSAKRLSNHTAKQLSVVDHFVLNSCFTNSLKRDLNVQNGAKSISIKMLNKPESTFWLLSVLALCLAISFNTGTGFST